jgi:iron complex transport system permease protein
MKAPAYPVLVGGLALLVALLAALSLMAGRVWVPWSAWTSLGQDPRWAIIFELRVPRTVLGVLVGAALGASGAALQGYTRNPLADPGVLGISGMAALGGVISLYFGLTVASAWLLPAMAMAGAALGVVILLLLAGSGSSMVTFILAGVILQTMATAGTALALNLAPTPWAVNEIVNWLLGAVADRSIDEVRLAAPFVLVGLVVLLTTARGLDALTLGETGAKSLGVDLSATRLILATGVALAVGASVAVSGAIGFVGLVVPNLMRPLVGARPGALIVPSALAGAALVLAADIAVRLTPSPAEVKLAVAMAAIGGPFFLVMLARMRRRIA